MFKAGPLSFVGRLGGVLSRHDSQRLPRPILDHFPIFLETRRIDSCRILFKFENMWLEFEGFSDLIKGWWGRLKLKVLLVTLWQKSLSLSKRCVWRH